MQTDSKNHETSADVKRVLPAVSIEEAAEIIQALYYYGRIHTVHGLIYGESHERYLSRAMTWLHFYRSSKNGSNGRQLPEGGDFETHNYN